MGVEGTWFWHSGVDSASFCVIIGVEKEKSAGRADEANKRRKKGKYGIETIK